MRQIWLLAMTAVAMSQLGFAGTCGSGSLQSYVNLGSGGCTIGGDTLSNFQLLAGTFGATPINTSLVTINPTGSTYSPAITISTIQSVLDGNAVETMFTYDISGSPFTGISAVLGNSSESGIDGGVTGLVNICAGGSFGPDGVDGCNTNNTASLTTVDGVQNSDQSGLGPIKFLNVTDDFEISGPATGGTLTNSFTAVPEPLSSTLTALCLALAGALKIRSLRAKQEENKGVVTNE